MADESAILYTVVIAPILRPVDADSRSSILTSMAGGDTLERPDDDRSSGEESHSTVQ